MSACRCIQGVQIVAFAFVRQRKLQALERTTWSPASKMARSGQLVLGGGRWAAGWRGGHLEGRATTTTTNNNNNNNNNNTITKTNINNNTTNNINNTTNHNIIIAGGGANIWKSEPPSVGDRRA